MIETVFTLEDEPMTPGTDAPEEGGMEEGTPSEEPQSVLEDEEGGSKEAEAKLEDESETPGETA